MPVKVVSLESIPAQEMPGRTLQWLGTPQNMGTQHIGLCILQCPVGQAARPLHGHRDTEEVLFILQGQGEAYVDGEIAPFQAGDAVLFPANSKHMIRNTGAEVLRTVCVFSPPTSTASYLLFDEENVW